MENEQTYPELEKAKAEQEKLKLHHLSIDLTLEGMPGEIELPKGERGLPGERGEQGVPGSPGRDGFTPVVTVTDTEDGTHVITITQPEGRAPITTTIKDGKPGAPGRDGVDGQSITGAKGDPGRDGFTPVITVTDKEDGSHVITITQPDGRPPITTTIKDGKAGARGEKGERGLPADSPITLADIMRLDRVKSHSVSYLFTMSDYDGVLFTGQHYLKEGRQNGYHWWADIRSTYDNDLEVKMEKLTDAQLRKTMVIDYDGATYDITRFNRTGGYSKNPGEFWTALTKAFRSETAIQPDISTSTAVDKLTRAMNFKGAFITGYLYTIHTGYSVNNKFYLIVDKQLVTHANPNYAPAN
jgi:surface-anchored protein